MRTCALALLLVVVVFAVSLGAQQSQLPVSVEQVRMALQRSQHGILSTAPGSSTIPPIRRFGIVTFVPPDTNGEVVKAALPIGELAMRAVHGLSAAQRRRAEDRAHNEVVRALQDFQALPRGR
jgi:hypothetical protein